MANFQWERLLMALGAVGGMQAAFEKTLRYANERTAFGRPIGKHQAIRHKLAEIAVTIEAGRDVTYAALRRYVAGEDAVREVTIAKLATQRAAFDVMDACLQIHGGAGYIAEYDIERAAARRPARADRRRDRRDHEGDPRALARSVTPNRVSEPISRGSINLVGRRLERVLAAVD